MASIDRNLLNICQMGLAFFFVYTSLNTSNNVQQYVIESTFNNRNGSGPPIGNSAGYTSSAIYNGALCLCTILSPPIVKAINEKWSMFIGGLSFIVFFASFFYITNAFIYTCSALLGFGVALLWVSQGSYLSKNSNELTASRNSGIFWFLYQTSLCIGGLIAYFIFNNSTDTNPNLSDKEIRMTFICFMAIVVVGLGVFAFLRIPNVDLANKKLFTEPVEEADFLKNLFKIVKLFATKPMLLITVTCIFAGLEQEFWGGVYGTALGNMLVWPNHKDLVSLHEIFVGIGALFGAGVFSFFGQRLNRFHQSVFVFAGLIISLLAYFLIFINVPSDAPLKQTYNIAYINPNQYLALFCSVLLGLADAIWNIQIFSLLSSNYSKFDAASAFCLITLFKGGAMSVSFFYIGLGHLVLQYDLLILGIFASFGAVGFVNAEWLLQNKNTV